MRNVGVRGSATQFVQGTSLAWGVALAAIPLIGEAASRLLIAQGAEGVAHWLRLATLVATAGWSLGGLVSLATPRRLVPTTLEGLGALTAGCLAAELLARFVDVRAGLAVQAATAGIVAWWTWRLFKNAPRWRLAAIFATSAASVAALIWFLVRHGWLMTATGLTGIAGMALACVVGLAAIRLLLGGAAGIPAVARAMIDEAVRMRVALAMLILLLVAVPVLPLVLDQSERLEYRVQFFLNWSLGGTAFILSLLTIFLACGSVCGDIDSYRVHMSLAKPLGRGEYLVGKWLGIVLLDLLLLVIAGAATLTFIRVLQSTTALSDDDRQAVDRQILTARVMVPPQHDNPEEYSAAVAEAIAQLEKDDPDAFTARRNRTIARIRREFEWQWHSVRAGVVSTYVFKDLKAAKQLGEPVQLQLKPRAYNVDVDMADVRFATSLNGRPWPLKEGKQKEHTLGTMALHTLEIPADFIDDNGVLKLTVENRNLVPPGETQPTTITFPPGDGLRLLRQAGGFDRNFIACLAIMWFKLTMVAAAAVAAGSCLSFPTAALLSLVIYFSALGSGLLKAGLGEFAIEESSAIRAVAARLVASGQLIAEFRLYEAARMLLGFISDFVLWSIPAFSDYDSVSSLASGLAIQPSTVLWCLLQVGLVYPIAFGVLGWLSFEKRDIVRSNS